MHACLTVSPCGLGCKLRLFVMQLRDAQKLKEQMEELMKQHDILADLKSSYDSEEKTDLSPHG